MDLADEVFQGTVIVWACDARCPRLIRDQTAINIRERGGRRKLRAVLGSGLDRGVVGCVKTA